jgi:ATP-dependent HslUV protease ATP-binding subunit HslU
VEGSTVTTKYGMVRTDHILFIAAGAFNVSKPSDLLPELQGRFPIRVELDSLTEADFIRILKEPKNALITQYKALLTTESVNLIFEDSAVEEIARIASQGERSDGKHRSPAPSHGHGEASGRDLFDAPDRERNGCDHRQGVCQEKLKGILEDENLSRYIL